MLKDKVAIVTGSTSGIGLGIAKELAKLGADIVLNGFGDAGEIEAIRSGIERDHGVRVAYDGADMSKGDAVRGLIAATVEEFGRLDILVNNAGIQFTAPVEEFPAAKWDAILAINLSAAFHGISAAVPQMKKQRWGRIADTTEGRVICRRWKEWVGAQVKKYDWDIDPDDADHPTIHGLRGTGILARSEEGYEVDQIANDIGMSRQNVEHYMRFRDQMKVGADGQKRLRLVNKED
jgi:short chain dehydrogenase